MKPPRVGSRGAAVAGVCAASGVAVSSNEAQIQQPVSADPLRVLHVEDDLEFSIALGDALRGAGLEVDVARTDHAAFGLVAQRSYDVAIIDAILSGSTLDGLGVVHRLRRLCPDMGLVMLTVSRNHDLTLMALRGGCDDYLTKPFEVDELIARLQAVARRTSRRPPAPSGVWAREAESVATARPAQASARADSRPPVFRIGTWRVELAGTPRLNRPGAEQALSDAEGKLVAFLVRRRGACHASRDMAREVYGRTDRAAEDLVRKVIDRLRAKLGDDAGRIEHVQGKGYRLRERGERS